MFKLTIHEEVENPEEMIDLLNEIATKIQEGYTSGYHPGWSLDRVEEPLKE